MTFYQMRCLMKLESARFKLFLARLIYALLFIVIIVNYQNYEDSYIGSKSVKKIFDFVIAISCIAFLFLKNKEILSNYKLNLIVIFLFIVAALVSISIKPIYLCLIFFVGKYFGRNEDLYFYRLLKFLVVSNIIIMLVQVMGISIYLSSFQYYGNSGLSPINIFHEPSEVWYPDNQIRPSGIFPSTIYLSIFETSLIGYLVLSNIKIEYYYRILLAIFFVITGSVTSFILVCSTVLASMMRLSKLKIAYLYLLTIIIYIIIMPQYFVESNYSLIHLLESMWTRFIYADGGNSSILLIPYYILSLIGIFLIFRL